jgi:hypothetical protein
MLLPIAAEVSKTTLALIAGGSAVVGSAVGGLVSGAFGLRGERKRQLFARETRDDERDHQTQQELKLARGAAREMRATFRQSRERLHVALESKGWWPQDEPLRTSPAHFEERKLLASLMTKEQWDAIERADTAIAAADEMRGWALALVSTYTRETHEPLERLPWESITRAAEHLGDRPFDLDIDSIIAGNVAAVDAAIAKLNEFDEQD